MTKEAGRPKLFTSADDVDNIIEDYFKTAAYMGEGDNRMFAPTMSGLANHLGMDRRTLLEYSKDDIFSPTIKRARERVHQALEQRLYGNNVTGIIFNLKNNFGWKDVKATEISGTDGEPIKVADVSFTFNPVDEND